MSDEVSLSLSLSRALSLFRYSSGVFAPPCLLPIECLTRSLAFSPSISPPPCLSFSLSLALSLSLSRALALHTRDRGVRCLTTEEVFAPPCVSLLQQRVVRERTPDQWILGGLVDSCTIQLKAEGLFRTCNERQEEEEEPQIPVAQASYSVIMLVVQSSKPHLSGG